LDLRVSEVSEYDVQTMGQGEGGGPKSERGKMVTRNNALNHTLTSRAPVIPHVESAREWNKFRTEIVKSLEPDGPLEEELAEQAALLLWRMRRVTRYEHESLEGTQDRIMENLWLTAKALGSEWPPESDDDFKAEFFRHCRQLVIPDERAANKIVRWESHLRRQLRSALRELRLVQTFRRDGKHGTWVEVRRE